MILWICFWHGVANHWLRLSQSVISLAEQLEHFKEYIGKLRGAVGDEKTNFTLAKSMFLLVAGSDDIANTYFTAGVRKLQYNMFTYTDMIAESASNFLQVRTKTNPFEDQFHYRLGENL